MDKKPHQFYEYTTGSYNNTSVAHEYVYPEIRPNRQRTQAKKKEQMKRAILVRLIAYILAVFLVFGGVLASSVLYKGENDALQRNTQKLSRLENDNIRYQAELSRKTAPETIRAIASAELGMNYVVNEPIYIRVKQGEQILVHK